MSEYIAGEVVARAEWEARRAENPRALPWEQLDEDTRRAVIFAVNARSSAILAHIKRTHTGGTPE